MRIDYILYSFIRNKFYYVPSLRVPIVIERDYSIKKETIIPRNLKKMEEFSFFNSIMDNIYLSKKQILLYIY